MRVFLWAACCLLLASCIQSPTSGLHEGTLTYPQASSFVAHAVSEDVPTTITLIYSDPEKR
ncbi:MAG: hypothetical protein WCG27_11955, partial [Pseudomonadota bacterium]